MTARVKEALDPAGIPIPLSPYADDCPPHAEGALSMRTPS